MRERVTSPLNAFRPHPSLLPPLAARHLRPAVQRAQPGRRRGLRQRQQRAAGADAGAVPAAAGRARGGRSAGPQGRGKRGCKGLRETKTVEWHGKDTSSDDLALLGTLGSVLLALEKLTLGEPAAGPDGVPRLAEKLGAGALPAVTSLVVYDTHVGDAGASALAAALGRGALPRLKYLHLANTAIGDAGLVALAPALRRRPALGWLTFWNNPFGDEGLAALVAPPPPPAGAPPPTGGLAKLKQLSLSRTKITDAGCDALAAALDGGALPALESLYLLGTRASAAARAAVTHGGARARNLESRRARLRPLLTRSCQLLTHSPGHRLPRSCAAPPRTGCDRTGTGAVRASREVCVYWRSNGGARVGFPISGQRERRTGAPLGWARCVLRSSLSESGTLPVLRVLPRILRPSPAHVVRRGRPRVDRSRRTRRGGADSPAHAAQGRAAGGAGRSARGPRGAARVQAPALRAACGGDAGGGRTGNGGWRRRRAAQRAARQRGGHRCAVCRHGPCSHHRHGRPCGRRCRRQRHCRPR